MFNDVKDYEAIERIIQENRENYIDNAFYLDRLDSEIQHAFVIRCNNEFKSAIVFDSVKQFENWIKD